MASISGVVFYEGPSRIDGQPIVGIATFNSKNEKTGPIVQTWIIRSDIHPNQAIDTGADKSVCGSCPLRGLIRPASEITDKRKIVTTPTVNKGRSCYVLVQQAPAAIYKAYKAGKYPKLNKRLAKKMQNKGLRYGSYGDPVSIPIPVWEQLKSYCTGKAEPGYTHQWRNPKFAPWRKMIMASTHTVNENELAASKGWRTFRTITNVNELSPLEIICPASPEGGFKADCATCGACNGRRSTEDMRRNVAIVAHGSGGKTNLVAKVIASKS